MVDPEPDTIRRITRANTRFRVAADRTFHGASLSGGNVRATPYFTAEGEVRVLLNISGEQADWLLKHVFT